MRVRTLLVLLVTAVAALLPVAAAGPAAAGGPTSVLMSSPVLGRTSSLYTERRRLPGAGRLRRRLRLRHRPLRRADRARRRQRGHADLADPRRVRVAGGPDLRRRDGRTVDRHPGGGRRHHRTSGRRRCRWHRSDQAEGAGRAARRARPHRRVRAAAPGRWATSRPARTSSAGLGRVDRLGRRSTGSGADEPVRAAEPAAPTGPAGIAPWVALVVGLLVGAGATAGGALVLARRRARDGRRPRPGAGLGGRRPADQRALSSSPGGPPPSMTPRTRRRLYLQRGADRGGPRSGRTTTCPRSPRACGSTPRPRTPPRSTSRCSRTPASSPPRTTGRPARARPGWC